jgi:Skp family chaperone for outer membrane proteins
MLNILSINFPLIGEAILIALIVLAFFMWYLTREILKMENILLYLDIIFTIVWTIASTTSTVQAWGIPLSGAYATIFYYVWLIFAGLSALLALISYLMFIKKYLGFKEIERKFTQVKDGHDNYNIGYNQTRDKISQVEKNLKDINSEISEAINMLEDARRAPEKIIVGETSASQGETIPAQLNTVVIGLGGVGTALVSGIGIQTGGESSYLKTSILDNLITKNVIRDGNEPFLFILYDTNGNNIDAINKKYNNKLFSNIVKTFTYQNSWTQAAMTNTNPYLVGLNFNVVAGTGNNRIVGIAAYNTVRELFLNDIKNSISQLIGRTHKDKTVIYIINSWGGGTGSGTFIKFAQDLKEKLSEIPAFQASPPYIYGIGVLPAAQEGDINKANAYAAFKEMTFIMQPEQNIIGEVQRRRIRNPFNGYLLVSRDITNQTKDIEISTGISNLIIDLSTTIKEQGQQLRFDTTDIETRFRTYSLNNFSTFEFYNIYFPASVLSWYKVIGEPKSKRLNNKISEISKDIDNIKNDIREKLQRKVDELLRDTENLSDMLKQYKSESPYRSFINKINNFQNQNNNIRADIGPNGKIDIRNLSSKIEDLESEDPSKENNFPNTKQKVGYFVSVVNGEEARLRYPSPTGISYSFSVNPDKFALPNEKHGPEKIDIGVLTNPQYNLLRIIQDLGKEDELTNAYNSLQKPLGQAGPLLTLNYANIGLTMNIDLEIINFIREVNPGLLLNLETNPFVKRPSVGDIVVLPSTNPEILSSNRFPTQEAFTRNLLHSANSVEYGQSSLPFKKYSITNYRILFNVPLYYYSPDEDPMMPIIRDYRNSYKNRAANNYKNMLVHHTLLYDVGIEGLRNLGIEIDPNELARDQVTGFWVNYEPFIGEEYSSKLYTVLSYGKLYKSLNQIKEIINNEVFGEIQKLDYGVITVRDLANIQNKINGLSAIIQNLINNINRFKESFENIEKIYKFANDDFKGMVDNMKQKVSELYAEIGKAPEQFESDINVLNKKLDELYVKFDSDKKITERNNIKKIKESLNDLSRKFNPVINGYSEIFSNF